MTSFTPVILVTGSDNQGNQFSFWKSLDKWIDSYNECETSAEFIRKHVFPNVRTAIVGDVVLTCEQWRDELGCPISVSDEQIHAVEQAYRIEQPTVSESVQAEIDNDTNWLGSIADDEPEGTDTSHKASLTDAGFGSGGPF